MADPKVINYAGGQKIYNKEKTDQEIAAAAAAVQANVDDVSAALAAEVVRATGAEGDLANLTTTDKSSLVNALNEVKASGFTVDPTVSAGSTNPVASTGVKDYVDTQDEATLDAAKYYTDGKIGTLEASDGSTVVELTGHLGDLDNAAESLVQAINHSDTRIGAAETDVTDLRSALATERQKRIEGDQRLADMVSAVDQAKQDKLTFDDAPTHGSDNPVKSTGIKDYVDEITGQLSDLDVPAESLVAAINTMGGRFTEPDDEMSASSENAVQNKVIKAYVDDRDLQPTEGSDKAVTSNGVYEAVKKSEVKIGEIMDWPQFTTESRLVHSDNPFTFNFNGEQHTVNVPDAYVELQIASHVPTGWVAMDGTAVLTAATNPELASFFGGRNTTTDGRIWIPYLAKKIIKVAY